MAKEIVQSRSGPVNKSERNGSARRRTCLGQPEN